MMSAMHRACLRVFPPVAAMLMVSLAARPVHAQDAPPRIGPLVVGAGVSVK